MTIVRRRPDVVALPTSSFLDCGCISIALATSILLTNGRANDRAYPITTVPIVCATALAWSRVRPVTKTALSRCTCHRRLRGCGSWSLLQIAHARLMGEAGRRVVSHTRCVNGASDPAEPQPLATDSLSSRGRLTAKNCSRAVGASVSWRCPSSLLKQASLIFHPRLATLGSAKGRSGCMYGVPTAIRERVSSRRESPGSMQPQHLQRLAH